MSSVLSPFLNTFIAVTPLSLTFCEGTFPFLRSAFRTDVQRPDIVRCSRFRRNGQKLVSSAQINRQASEQSVDGARLNRYRHASRSRVRDTPGLRRSLLPEASSVRRRGQRLRAELLPAAMLPRPISASAAPAPRDYPPRSPCVPETDSLP